MSGDLVFEIKRFSDLSTSMLYEILKLRCEVFVVEQRCAYPDIDGEDRDTWHLIGTMRDAPDKPVAYVFAPSLSAGSHNGSQQQQQPLTITTAVSPLKGLLAASLLLWRTPVSDEFVAPSHRQLKLGQSLMLRAIEGCDTNWPGESIQIGHSATCKLFIRLGFEVSSGCTMIWY